MPQKVTVFWFRRDLRLNDNVGFFKALDGKHPVLPIFIFDSEIVNELPPDDARVTFIHDTLQEIRAQFEAHGSGLALYYGKPLAIFKKLIKDFEVQNVIANHDYETYAQDRDQEIKSFLFQKEIGFYTFKDQVIFEKQQIVKNDGLPYVVYTPYKNKWKAAFKPEIHLKPHTTLLDTDALLKEIQLPNLRLEDIGFTRSTIKVPEYKVTTSLINEYEETRNFPAVDGTSHLGPHLRFGTVSIRQMMQKAIASKNETFMNEIIWREFFMQIMWHFPKTQHNAFKSKYNRIKWRNNEEEFNKWKQGETGYLLVDAGMRELNTTGHMHNRVRMLVASFLCKHLLIDWRWGEAYFAEKLLDYELSSNVGNWQWAAGSGVDAAPYFRIFNPMTQVEKFDKDKNYIKKWIPEFDSDQYPAKMVDHKEARTRCLKAYKEALR